MQGMSTGRGKPSTSARANLRRRYVMPNLPALSGRPKKRQRQQPPLHRRNAIGNRTSPPPERLLASLDNIASVTNLLRNLENGVSDAPAVPVDNNREDALSSCIERLNPFGDEALQAQLARNRRVESQRQREEQIRVKKKYRLMNFQWSAPQTSITAPSMMMAPNSARSIAQSVGGKSESALSLFEDSLDTLPSEPSITLPDPSVPADQKQDTNGVHGDSRLRFQQLQDTNRLATAAGEDAKHLYHDLRRVHRKKDKNRSKSATIGAQQQSKTPPKKVMKARSLDPIISRDAHEGHHFQQNDVAREEPKASPLSLKALNDPVHTAASSLVLSQPLSNSSQHIRMPPVPRTSTRTILEPIRADNSSARAPNKQPAVDPLASQFSREHKLKKLEFRKITNDMNQIIDEMSSSLPEAMVVRFGMSKEAKKRAMANFNRIFTAFVLRCFIRPRFDKWIWFKENAEFLEQTAASKVLQRYIRGFLARCKLFHLRRNRRVKRRDHCKKLEAYIVQRAQATILVQALMRRRLAQNRARHERRRLNAANCLIRFWLATAAKRLCAKMRIIRDRKNAAASKIQRCWWGFVGRKQFWKDVKVEKAQKREERFQKKDYIVRLGFERLGADLTIQRWWRNLLWRKSFTKRIINTERNRNATIIQRFVRGFLGRASYIKSLMKFVTGKDTNYPPNLSFQTEFMKRQMLKAISRNWTDTAEHRVVFPPVSPDSFLKLKKLKGKPPKPPKWQQTVQKAPEESQSRALLIKWRHRGDKSLVQIRSEIMKNDRLTPAECKVLVLPFDNNALQIAGLEALERGHFKRAALLMRRAMLYDYADIFANAYERYFVSKRCGRDLLEELYHLPKVLLANNERVPSEAAFWALCGYAHFGYWHETRSYKALEYSYESFKIALTYAENVTEKYLLASAQVATQWGDYDMALQSLAAYITEYPTGSDLSNVIFLAACALRQAGAHDQACEYFTGLAADPPQGLSEAHILLQIARTRMEQGDYSEAVSAATEIFATRKRRRQIPRGIGTMEKYFARVETWMTFAKEYEQAGHDLAAADAYAEALRIALADDWGSVQTAFGGETEGSQETDNGGENNIEQSTPGEYGDDVNYTPKKGYTIAEAHAAALKLQTRFRAYRGKLAFHLKKQARKALQKEMEKIRELSHVMYRSGKAFVHVGRVVEAVTLLNRVYELSGKTVRQTAKLSMICPDEISEAFVESSRLMAHLRQAQDEARAYDPINAPLTPFFAALQIQRYYRRRHARIVARHLRRDRAAKILQTQWVTRYDRYGLGQFRARVKATRMLQKAFRGKLARMFMKEVNRIRKLKFDNASKMQSWYRRFNDDRQMAKRRERLRIRFETLRVGFAATAKTSDRLLCRLLLDYDNKYGKLVVSPCEMFFPNVPYRSDSEGESMMTILFNSLIEHDHTQFESKDPQMGEQLYKNFLKSTTVLTKKLTQSQADIVFAKIMRGHSERGLNLERFFRCILELGELKYGQKKLKKGRRQTQFSSSSRSPPKTKKKKRGTMMATVGNGKKDASAPSSEKVPSDLFCYRGFKGTDATFIKLMVEDVLPNKHVKTAVAKMRVKVEQRLNSAAVIMQTWYRGITGKSQALAYKMSRLKEAKLQKHAAACTVIQAFWRGFLGKGIAQKQAKAIYRKFLHFESKSYYWWNPKTKLEFWEKPRVFGSSDIKHVIEMPPPDQLYSLTCGHCGDTADRHCVQCDDDYCKECYALLHSKGKAVDHTYDQATLCVECGFQIASRICTTCKDFFCDWCFNIKHDSGRLRFHPWKNILPMCAECPPPRHEEELRLLDNVPKSVINTTSAEDKKLIQKVQFVARWHCVECDSELCNECYHREQHVGHTINALGFQNEDIVKAREMEEKRVKEEKLQAEVRARAEAEDLKRRIVAAEYLQRVWRGRQGRMWGKKYLQDERDARLKLFLENQRIRRYRQSMKYKVISGGKVVFYHAPRFLYKLARGAPESKEERDRKTQEKLQEKEKMDLLCLNAKQLENVEVHLEKDSEQVTILNKDDWKEVQVQERGKEPRHIGPNDRFRFVINNEMLLRDSTVAILSNSDPKVLLLSRAWEYDMAHKPTIRIWWMPQITEDEVEQRHQQKMKREKKLRREAKLARKSAEQVAYFADMFDETGFLGKWLNKKVEVLDRKCAALEAEIEGKKLLTASTEIVEENETDGFDESSSGVESLGVLGAANLKMKMKKFKKIAHENQNKSENVGEENAVPSANEEV